MDWSTSNMMEGWESQDCSDWKKDPPISMCIDVYRYLNGRCKARLLPVVSSDRMRGNRHKLGHRRFPLNITKHFFTVRVMKHFGTGCLETLWTVHPWRQSKAI